MSFRVFPRRPHTRVKLSRVISLALVAVVLLSGGLAVAMPTNTNAAAVNVLTNGSFEHGFTSQPGCGAVGYDWNCFTNGGAAGYGFYDDQWQPVVADGAHSQLIEVNTKGMHQGDDNRYAGIYQTVRVMEWEDYALNLSGMIRTTRHDGDPWRYRVEVGYTPGREADWRAVTNWQDVGWDIYYDRLEPGSFSNFTSRFTAKEDFVTVYIRVWKKWGVGEEEIDVNFDAISLTGPSPYGHAPVKPAAPAPQAPADAPLPQAKTESPMMPPAATPPAELVCGNGNYIHNGGFEDGFNPVYLGHVGRNWGFFTNGGDAGYGFYDEQWPPVVASGEHGQLIEINAKGLLEGDANRYAGIYQHIRGLTPGKTYELTVNGMLRGDSGGADPHRYEAQWGYIVGYDSDWTHVENWRGMDLGAIYPRTEPSEMSAYTVRFEAPAADMVLFLRGWKKWGHGESEFDLNLDDVSLSYCQAMMPPMPAVKPVSKPQPAAFKPAPVAPAVSGGEATACAYTIQPADMLSEIAADYGLAITAIMEANGISDPNLIYVGQTVQIPGCGAAAEPAPMPATEEPAAPAVEEPVAQTIHVVAPGDTLGAICQHYGVDLGEVVKLNAIANPSLIVVGQQIVIP